MENEINERDLLKGNIETQYRIYESNLKKQFWDKLQELKKGYNLLSEEEKQNLLGILKTDKTRFKEISALLAADKEKIIKRNNEMAALKTEYNRSMQELGVKRAADVKKVDEQFDYNELLKFRNNGIRNIQNECDQKRKKYADVIKIATERARKVQEHLNTEREALNKRIQEVVESYDAQFKKLCADNKGNPDFTVKRVIIPKELINISDGNMTILESDLDKLVSKSKKQIAAELCEEKKESVIKSLNEKYKEAMTPHLETLDKLNEFIELAKKKEKEAIKERDERLLLFRKKVAAEAARKGITRIEKYDPEDEEGKKSVKSSKKAPKAPKAAENPKRYKSKDKKQNKLIGFIKSTSLYKKITEKSNSKKDKKIEQMANEINQMAKIGENSEKNFFSNLAQGVNENPVYAKRSKQKISITRQK